MKKRKKRKRPRSKPHGANYASVLAYKRAKRSLSKETQE